MKRMITASSNSATLYAQYFSGLNVGDIGLRSMTVTRPTLKDALVEVLNHVELSAIDIDYDDLDDYTADDLIDSIQYAGIEGPDYIIYLQNKTTGEVYVSEIYPEENY